MTPQRRRYLIFGVLGILLYLLASWLLYFFLDRHLNWETRPGVLIGFAEEEGLEFETVRYPTVAFWYEGDSIKFKSRFGGSDMDSLKVGHPLMVHFPKGMPQEAEVKSPMNFIFPAAVYFIAVVFGGIGFSGYFLTRKSKRLGAKHDLYERRKGKKLTATITSVTQNNSAGDNGVNTYVIIAQWQDPTDETNYFFTSEVIWYDPGPLLAGRKSVDVFVDRKDMNRYHVDLKFLPPLPAPSTLSSMHDEVPIQT